MLRFFLSLPRKVRNRYKRYRLLHHREQRVRREVMTTAPMPVDVDGPAQIRMLCSHARLADGIATLKSFYRFSPIKYPLYFHDDGTFTQRDVQILREHFPGVHVHLRPECDRALVAELERRGLQRCIDLRWSQPHQLKLFDFVYYAKGKPFLQLDSDVLFYEPPTEIFDALAVAPGPEWEDRYNQDEKNWYTWSNQQTQKHLGMPIIPLCNVGVMCLTRPLSCFDFVEDCLAKLPQDNWDPYFLEQTLTALYTSAKMRSRPLDLRYDVAGRFSKAATGVISEHYCGPMRYLFYDHFSQMVFPRLAEAKADVIVEVKEAVKAVR